MSTTCKECHHVPSGRFNADGYQCHCPCHDLADQAPELQGWKDSAISILSAWDQVGEALGGCGLGESKFRAALREAKRLKALNAEMLTQLESLTDHLTDMGIMNEDSEGWKDAIAAIQKAKSIASPVNTCPYCGRTLP